MIGQRTCRRTAHGPRAARRLLALLVLVSAFLTVAPGRAADLPEKDLRTKEQRLYEIQLRQAQWKVDAAQLEMETKLSDYEENRDLFDQRIRTLEELNTSFRAYQKAQLALDQAKIALDQTRLSFLRKATHISIVEAKKYRTPDGHRQTEIAVQNSSDLEQAVSLNPNRSPAEVRALLEIQNLKVSVENKDGLIIGEPYEVMIPSLKLGEQHRLTFRLLDDVDEVVVAMTALDGQRTTFKIVLRKESLQDIPTISSVQFSQEGDLNTKIRYDLILERLAEDEKTFRLAVVNLPSEISFAFLDQATSASLTQVKFSEEVTRQQLELELQIPEKLSRRFVDQTLEFYVFVTDEEGFGQVEELNRRSEGRGVDLEAIQTVRGSRERFELIPRGKGALEILIANRYQEVKTGEEVQVKVDLLNSGTLEVEGAHLVLTPPLGWTYATQPDTIPRIAPGEKEPLTVTLTPPGGLGVSEYDVRLEALGHVGEERIEAQEKDLTIRVKASANLLRNALIIGTVVALVVGVAVASIKISRR
ncbi:MAG: NEW3 domain-containing protein [Candidatus Latescibacterota bacterium]|jgi:hypothetical protein